MKSFAFACIFLLFLFAPSFTLETLISSGSANTVISSGNLTLSNYPYNVPFPVSSAKWVWNQNWSNSPNGETITFFNKFRILCACKIFTLYITADNNFKAYINGNFLLAGSNWPTVYSAVIPSDFLNIGDNTL